MCFCMCSLARLWPDVVCGKHLLGFGSAEKVSQEIRRKEEVRIMVFFGLFCQSWLGVLVGVLRYLNKAAQISS